MGGTIPTPRRRTLPRGNGGIVSMGVTTIIGFGITLSLFFIMAMCFAFLGEEGDVPFFKNALADVAQNSPGIVLLGESVDVDVDEPSITIRWSIHGCGDEFVLPNSSGIGGSSACGLPVMALSIFVDSNVAPVMQYDPNQLPFVLSTGQRRSVQNLVQFDSNHVLDAHQAHLYPFDTYLLATSLRAVSPLNASVPIQKVILIDQTANFLFATTDIESYNTLANGTQIPTRDLDLRMKRPAQARAFAMMLFGISWMLAHMTLGLVVIIWYSEQSNSTVLKFLALSFGALVAIPQFRNAMPDAPGFDGSLIDYIGFFPQMIFSGLSMVVLLVILISREFDLGSQDTTSDTRPALPPSPLPSYKGKGYHKMAKSPAISSANSPSYGRSTASIHMQHDDLSQLMQHLNGEFSFPKSAPSQIHRRNQSSRYQASFNN